MNSLIFRKNFGLDVLLKVIKSDHGYHFEIFKNGQLIFLLYFLYGEKLHKAAYCLGGAVYGFFNDDKLAEDMMQIIDENKDLFGGDELRK